MLNTFRAHAGQFMKIAAIACALCLAMAALAGCSSSDSQQEKTPAQVNREYMSSVNSISQEAASALSNFSDAAAKQDVAAMRVAASNATKALDKIAALEAPDALKDVKSEYEAGANDLGQALSDYVEIYAQIKNAGENLDAAAEAAKGIDDVKARYDSGIEHLSKADSMVADMADSSTSGRRFEVMAGQNNHRSVKRGSNKGPRLSYAAQNQQGSAGREGAQEPRKSRSPQKQGAGKPARKGTSGYAKNAAAQAKYAGKGASHNVCGGRQKHAVVHHAPRSAFLPVNMDDVRARGWDGVDFAYVCGDAYVDQSSFGMAIISRVLESHGYKVGIIAQPDWRDPESVNVFGEPRLGFLVSSGNMDSMVNHYTVNKVPRSQDAYSPGGAPNRRRTTPRRCTATSYDARISTRPLFWAASRRACVAWRITTIGPIRLSAPFCSIPAPTCLFMAWGERAIVEIADALAAGIAVEDITFVNGTAYKADRSKAWKTPSSCRVRGAPGRQARICAQLQCAVGKLRSLSRKAFGRGIPAQCVRGAEPATKAAFHRGTRCGVRLAVCARLPPRLRSRGRCAGQLKK